MSMPDFIDRLLVGLREQVKKPMKYSRTKLPFTQTEEFVVFLSIVLIVVSYAYLILVRPSLTMLMTLLIGLWLLFAVRWHRWKRKVQVPQPS